MLLPFPWDTYTFRWNAAYHI